ncbi:MAG: Single-stranded DNA-binding protein [Labilithrix sp.]|nr:Single-stranded DNA-binding protein [Labilithrix sp.]
MSGINSVIVSGNLGADPELRMAAGGTAILNLRIATDESWIDKDNKLQERTEWHRVTVFGKRAEGLAKFLRKGMFVSVKGSLRTSSYDKEGQKHYSTQIIAEDVAVPPKSSGMAKGPSADAPFPTFEDEAAVPAGLVNGARSRKAQAPEAVDIPF